MFFILIVDNYDGCVVEMIKRVKMMIKNQDHNDEDDDDHIS